MGNEGGSYEIRNIGEFGFLKAKNRGHKGFDSSPNIVSLTTLAKTTDVPTGKNKFH
jgi:hypothetical protein